MKLEFVDFMKIAHPFTKPFEHVYHCANDAEVSAIGTGQYLEALTKRTPEEIEQADGKLISVWTSTFYIGLEIAPKPRKFLFVLWWLGANAFFQAGTIGPQRLDITFPTNEFKKMAQMWDGYDSQTMALHVSHMKG